MSEIHTVRDGAIFYEEKLMMQALLGIRFELSMKNLIMYSEDDTIHLKLL